MERSSYVVSICLSPSCVVVLLSVSLSLFLFSIPFFIQFAPFPVLLSLALATPTRHDRGPPKTAMNVGGWGVKGQRGRGEKAHTQTYRERVPYTYRYTYIYTYTHTPLSLSAWLRLLFRFLALLCCWLLSADDDGAAADADARC